jgi:hypothetical protein
MDSWRHWGGRHPKLMRSLAKTDLLVLYDFGTNALSEEHRRDLLEILDDRYGALSTLATSQYPLAQRHELIGDPILADAILDRLVHIAYKSSLKGVASWRRAAAVSTHTAAVPDRAVAKRIRTLWWSASKQSIRGFVAAMVVDASPRNRAPMARRSAGIGHAA